jgi:protein-disulfide isomerase
MMRASANAVGVVILVLLTACSTAAQSPRPQAPSDVVATVGSASITLSDVDERALRQTAGDFGSVTLAQALFDARRAALDEIVGNELLDREAKARGVDRATLIKDEIDAKVSAPTDVDVAAWYQANPSRVQGSPLDQVAGPIKALLLEERTQAARQQYLDGLKARTAVTIRLEPPRVKVADAGRPSRGPARAPVEIIEFSDFQCPFCLRAHPTVTQVLNTYGDRVHFVYRHYPLPNHPNARPAAEAAACAAEQGKFWEYHDRLFDNQSKLGDADLKEHAAALALDTAKFDACVDTHKYKDVVDADMAAGEEAGVSGTPAFFINGRQLSGAQPFEVFKRVIDEELAGKR